MDWEHFKIPKGHKLKEFILKINSFNNYKIEILLIYIICKVFINTKIKWKIILT